MTDAVANDRQIIVVDDDPSVREAIRTFLGSHGFEVRAVAGGMELDRALAATPADVVILDLMMPGEDGLAICRRLAPRGIAVLMLSALGDVTDRVVGLELGAADYLAKPFDPRELLARVRALLRRNLPAADAVHHFAGWRYDPGQCRLDAPGGEVVTLTRNEHQLLRCFLDRPGRLLSRDQLLDAIHGRDAGQFDRAVDLAVSRLRRKLGEAGPDIIQTVRGAGYRLGVGVRRL